MATGEEKEELKEKSICEKRQKKKSKSMFQKKERTVLGLAFNLAP